MMLEYQTPGTWRMNQLNDPDDQRVRITKSKKRKKVRSFVLAMIIMLVLILGVRILSPGNEGTLLVDYQEGEDQVSFLGKLKNFLIGNENSLKQDENGRVNILILGMGGAGHDGPYLTDSIVIASYSPKDNDMALLSIPRDLAVYIPGQGFRKINSANAFSETQKEGSGGDYTRLIISELLDLEIPYSIRIDFQAFHELVDALGGVEVNVERAFTDYQFPAANDQFRVVSFRAGPQTMDGDTALAFVRSRYGCCGEGGDFARARRQQIFLSALKEKLTRENLLTDPKKLISMYKNYQKNVTSNFRVSEVIAISSLAKNSENISMRHYVFHNGPDGELEDVIGTDGAYLLQPKGGNYALLKKNTISFINQTTQTAEENTQNTIQITILNGTPTIGLASETAETLKAKGYDVVKIGNAPTDDYKKNLVYDLSAGKKSEALSKLSRELSAVSSSDVPDWVKNITDTAETDALLGGTDFVVVLGTE